MGEIFERPLPPRALERKGERLFGDTSGQIEIEHLHRYFFARSLCRGLDVLDIASGDGSGSAILAQVARSVVGFEIDEASVRHASEAYTRPGLSYLRGDARKISLPDSSVDAVISFETLEHFCEHDVFISEIQRVLRPGGILVISSPEPDIYSPAGGIPNSNHDHKLTHSEFDDLLRRHFRSVALYGQRSFLGSALIPEFTPAVEAKPFLTFERRDGQLFEASIGLPRSVYLVAVASNAPVELSRGCLFVETSSIEAIYAREVHSADEQKHLTDRLIQQGECTHRIQAELNRCDAQLAAKVTEVKEARAALAERARRESAIHLKLNREKSGQALSQARLQVLLQRLDALRERLKKQAVELETLRADSVVLAQQNVALRVEAESVAEKVACIVQEKIGTETELQAVYRSSSWRLTGPIRGLVERHPRVLQRLRARLLHSRIRRLAVRSVRGARRVLTLCPLWNKSPLAAPLASSLTATTTPAPKILPLLPAILPPKTLQPQAEPHTFVAFTPHRIPAHTTPHRNALRRGQGRRLLLASHVLPFPSRAGNEYRIHSLLRWLSLDNWKVTLVLSPLPGDPLSETHIAQMASVYPDLIVCEHDGTVWHSLAEGADVVEQLRGVVPRDFSTLLQEAAAPLSQARIIQLQRSFCPDVLTELLLRLDEAIRPDVFLAEYIFMTRPFSLLRPGIVKLVDTLDVFSTKASKVELHGVSDGLALSAEEEALLLCRADILIGIQHEEAMHLARLSPENQVLTIGVDFQVIEQFQPPPSEPVVLLVASANPMNIEGAQDFLKCAWPLVRQAIPGATLRIVGSIGAALEASLEGVQIAGQVDQLAPEYAAARVAINPAIAGTGLKIKTIEALCHLRPIVTWPAGVNGIDPESQHFCYVATHWFGFAQALIQLLTDDEKAGAIGKARDSLAQTLSTEFVYAPLRRALEQVR